LLDKLSYITYIIRKRKEIGMSAIYKGVGQRIKKMREDIGISQDDLAKKLGIPRPAISQIETGERKISADELIKLSNTFNLDIESLLGLKKEPQVLLPEVKEKVEPKPQIRINVPQKNLEKFKEVLLYILNKVGSKPNIGETVIYKLLYFIDFDYYEKYEEQLVGATYIKNNYGPTPIEFQKIVKEMIKKEEVTIVKDRYFEYPQTKYLPLKKPDLSKLKANEIALIDDILNRLSDMNATQISEYSHNDVPWLTTKDGEIIEYESVFYRTTPYSVRQYDEDIS
jgi:transcriptional regulator with XRE-family HTH domain